MERTKCSNMEFLRGRGRKWHPALPSCSHLVTFMMLLFGQQPFGYSSTAPTLCLSSLFTFKCHSYCTLCVLASAQEAGPVFSLQLVLGARQLSKLPGHWGIQTREFSRLGPGCSVTRIRFHQHSSNCLDSLEGPLFPPSLQTLGFSGLDLGEGK